MRERPAIGRRAAPPAETKVEAPISFSAPPDLIGSRDFLNKLARSFSNNLFRKRGAVDGDESL